MTNLIQWLLDLDDIRLGRDAPLSISWDNPFAAWLLFGFALLGATWVTVIYRRERTSVARRLLLAGVRCLVVTLVIVILCRPALVLQRNRIEPSYVALALDTSMSMATSEVYDDAALAAAAVAGAELTTPDELSHRSRLSLAQAALTRSGGAPLRRLLEHNGVQLCTFAGALEPQAQLASVEQSASLAEAVSRAMPDGTSTDLAGALRDVILKSKGRRLAAIVLASDGQSTQRSDLKDALDLASDRRIPVFPIRIGSTAKPLDIEVGPLRAQDSVFVDDIVAVEAQVAARGVSSPTTVTATLVDEGTETVLGTEPITFVPGEELVTIELRTKADRAGRARFRVEIAPLAAERSVDNNADRVDVSIVGGRLRVLYVDSYPRYEYRYLKNALLRERSVELSVLLLEADDRFVQEGTDPIRRFPETPEELNRYDVILFGDVDPQSGWLSPAQMRLLLDFVANEGGGFGLIAGERAVPHRFVGTPLETLIPVRIDPSFAGRYENAIVSGFKPRLTPEGRRSRLLRFTADRRQNESLFDELPALYWFAQTLGVRPGAATLAEHPTIRNAAGAMPLIVTGRYGAGKLFFQATDDTWLWRRHTGELLHDAYWVQVVRELMRGSRVTQDRRFAIRTQRRVYAYGTPVQAQVEFFDPELLARQEDVIQLTVAEQSGDRTDGNTPGNGEPGRPIDRVEVHRIGPSSDTFEGTWMPPKPGRFTIAADQLPVQTGETAVSSLFRVERPDLEAQHPEADHETLERIATATGGKVVALDELETLFASIQDRSVRIPDDLVEPLWDSKLALILFVLLLSIEWALRKVFGLL